MVGFDDISSAAYHLPSLTTVKQPLRQMGDMAAQLLIRRIQNPTEAYADVIHSDPELIARESTRSVPVASSAAPKKAGRKPKEVLSKA